MEGQAGRTGSSRSASKDENSQTHAVDAGFSSGTRDDESSSSSHSTRLSDLSATLRIFSESLLRKELAELQLIKSNEVLRCEAEKKRMELEIEMTQMLLQTQLQIALFVAGTNSKSRKRKRAEEEVSRVSQREGALLLSMLQCNLFL